MTCSPSRCPTPAAAVIASSCFLAADTVLDSPAVQVEMVFDPRRRRRSLRSLAHRAGPMPCASLSMVFHITVRPCWLISESSWPIIAESISPRASCSGPTTRTAAGRRLAPPRAALAHRRRRGTARIDDTIGRTVCSACYPPPRCRARVAESTSQRSTSLITSSAVKLLPRTCT